MALGLVAATMASVPRAGAAAPRARPSAYPTPYGATVPVGVDVPVELVTQINSATFNVGDSFAFKTSKDMKLGDLDIPAGTAGHGRVADVERATEKHNCNIAIQVDIIDLADGTPVWVNIDPKSRVQGHLADKHTRFFVIAVSTDFTGNMVLEPGTPFSVVTIAKRAQPAPLVTEAPSPEPAMSPSSAISPVPTVPSAKPLP